MAKKKKRREKRRDTIIGYQEKVTQKWINSNYVKQL